MQFGVLSCYIVSPTILEVRVSECLYEASYGLHAVLCGVIQGFLGFRGLGV